VSVRCEVYTEAELSGAADVPPAARADLSIRLVGPVLLNLVGHVATATPSLLGGCSDGG
jgi:hypothetical protein